ncbi:MAG: glycosyltransferase [Flavobacteriales bacterium]|nr:glycosyltransferase [Flavobacteriales bacterium]
MNLKKIILICPLDWGLGHATRCVPLIENFLAEGHQVLIGADKNPLAFLQQEFPTLKTVIIPGYEVTYNEKGSSLKLFYESIKFFNFIKEEHRFIDKIIEDNNIDLIVSDNRYGLYSDKIKSIIITHQLYVKAPLGEKIAHQKIEKLISNFDECWIPDTEENSNLSGDLSHLKLFKYPHKFIGVLSRFSSFPGAIFGFSKEQDRNLFQEYEFDIIAILSGPEPQRTVFEKLVLEQIEKNKLKAIVVRGLPLENEELRIENKELQVFNHLSTKKLYQYIQKSKVVVCRAGYSSIMDLAALNKKAILIPTPGQTEQEYLASYHLEQGNFYSQIQSEFDLKKGLVEVEKFMINQK